MTWLLTAACRGLDPIFDHVIDHPLDTYGVDTAKAICRSCPLDTLNACLNAAMTEEAGAHTRHGVRGGLDGAERVALYRASRRTA